MPIPLVVVGSTDAAVGGLPYPHAFLGGETGSLEPRPSSPRFYLVAVEKNRGVLAQILSRSRGEKSGSTRPDFISQPWRKIGEYSPRFYLAAVEKNRGVLAQILSRSRGEKSGSTRPDFISQPWRKIGEYSPRFYLAVVERNLPIFLHGCEIKSGRGFKATKQVCLSFSTPTISKVDVPKCIQIPHVFYNQSIVCIGIHPWCGASILVIVNQSQKVKHALSSPASTVERLAEGILQHWRTLGETLPNNIMVCGGL